MEGKKRKAGLFSKIKNREDALKTIKDCSIGFLSIAALQAILGYFIATSLIIDAIVYVILASILWKWNSRTAAILLLIVASIIFVTTLLTKLGIAAAGGSNIILAVIVFWAAIRAVEASFKLHGKYAEENI